MTTLQIKNMVCDRCITTVRQILKEAGFTVQSVELGKAEIAEEPPSEKLESVSGKLEEQGFELIRDEESILVEKIKACLINYLDHLEEQEDPQNVSEYLAERLHHNYSYLSSHFSSETNTTVEKYLILLKIERVKELLSYRQMTLSEIAWKLNYSSVQYLSRQFKKITGLSVTDYNKASKSLRKPLDKLEE
jgi:AraC-like DNA-binding protein